MSVDRWVGECLRKKKLEESWADTIISKANSEGNSLYKYHCNHCMHWHVTKRKQWMNRERLVFRAEARNE